MSLRINVRHRARHDSDAFRPRSTATREGDLAGDSREKGKKGKKEFHAL
jgi:hypothetical protein